MQKMTAIGTKFQTLLKLNSNKKSKTICRKILKRLTHPTESVGDGGGLSSSEATELLALFLVSKDWDGLNAGLQRKLYLKNEKKWLIISKAMHLESDNFGNLLTQFWISLDQF